MQNLHEQLEQNFPGYARWHQNPRYTFHHFLAFFTVAILVTTFTLNSINAVSLYYEELIPPPSIRVLAASSSGGQQLHYLTTQLLHSIKHYQSAPDVSKQAALDNLYKVAKARQDAMVKTAASNPKNFLISSIPGGLLDKMPAEILNFIEQKTEVSGILDVLQIDSTNNKKNQLEYKLNGNDGKKYNLRFANGKLSALTGSKIKASGLVIGNEMVVELNNENGFAASAAYSCKTQQAGNNANCDLAQLSQSPTSEVQITTGSAKCTPTNPNIIVSPLTQNGAAGQTLTYKITVYNNDSFACPSTNFNIYASGLPVGFTSGTGSANLAPKTSGSLMVSISSPSGAADNINVFSAIASDTENPPHSGAGQGAYVVFSDTIAPNITLTSPVKNLKIGREITLPIKASVSDNFKVVKIEFYIDSQLVNTQNTSATLYSYNWTIKNLSLGAHIITTKAYDAAGNVGSANITFYK